MNPTLRAHDERIARARRRRAIAQGVILLALLAAWLLMTTDFERLGRGKREEVIGVSGVVGGVQPNHSPPTAYLRIASTEDYARTGNHFCA